MRTVRKPLAAILQQQKKPSNTGKKKYRGALLGVDGTTHAIKDLPLSKRELSYLSLFEALKKNRTECGTTASDAPAPLSHSSSTICAALEYESFIRHHTATAYLGAMRSALGDIRSATMRKQRWKGEEKIEWKKIPLRQEKEGTTSDSDDSSTGSDTDSSSSSSEEDDDTMHSKKSSSIPPASTLGFTSASALVSSTHSRRSASASHPIPSPSSSSSHRDPSIPSVRSFVASRSEKEDRKENAMLAIQQQHVPTSSTASSNRHSLSSSSRHTLPISSAASASSSFSNAMSSSSSSSCTLGRSTLLKYGTTLKLSRAHPTQAARLTEKGCS